jgi:hypothetical protein
VVGIEDGSRDYPLNVNDRQTLTGYQVRVWSVGGFVADPRAGHEGRLVQVLSDNRNGTHDSATPVTNTDVFLVTSTNGGGSWSSPTLVDSSTEDQWFPWVDINPTNGTIGVLYHDREVADDTLYDTALTEFPVAGSPTKTIVSTAPSHPTQSRFFHANVAGCMNCAVFHGDYINVAYGSDGKANMVWTDMRDLSERPNEYRQFIYYARK